jgi:hypothetical protein
VFRLTQITEVPKCPLHRLLIWLLTFVVSRIRSGWMWTTFVIRIVTITIDDLLCFYYGCLAFCCPMRWHGKQGGQWAIISWNKSVEIPWSIRGPCVAYRLYPIKSRDQLPDPYSELEALRNYALQYSYLYKLLPYGIYLGTYCHYLNNASVLFGRYLYLYCSDLCDASIPISVIGGITQMCKHENHG